MIEIIFSIIIPFIGTVLGASTVFFIRKQLSNNVLKAFSGFAAGVMVAAAIFSLILPSFEYSSNKQNFLQSIIRIEGISSNCM